MLTWHALREGPRPAGPVPGAGALDENAALPAFVLKGPRGEFRNDDLRGRWSFVFFGYTQCPDICPTALSLMIELKSMTAAVPPAPTFQVVFVSVDPRRDTDALLAEYLRAFDASFIGVSGSDAELAPLVATLGVRYRRHDDVESRHYTVDHSASIYLVDPRGRLAATFPAPQTPAAMASAFRRIAQR